jgi:hypothetical protein
MMKATTKAFYNVTLHTEAYIKDFWQQNSKHGFPYKIFLRQVLLFIFHIIVSVWAIDISDQFH